MTIEEKIKQLLVSSKLPKKSQEIIADIRNRGLSFGSFTPKQEALINSIYTNLIENNRSVVTALPPRSMCLKCNDLGVLSVIFDGLETLCLCDCPQGDLQIWGLRSIRELGEVKFSALSPDEFKPKEGLSDQSISSMIKERVTWWRSKIAIAEGFWKDVSRQAETGKP